LTREGCGLCLEAKHSLQKLAVPLALQVEELDITAYGHEDYLARYCFDIPVGLVPTPDGEHELFRHRVEPAALKARLAVLRQVSA